mmetsp:Transcript_71011/g.104079  ORF Transcript_71011/g.104079 Transcript_71011/m.104079 type:complete len:134 (+) Transcript_71011:185-586(+)
MLRLLPRSDLPLDGVVIQNSESVNAPSSVKQDDERAETAIDKMGKRRRKGNGEPREIQRVRVCLCVSWDGQYRRGDIHRWSREKVQEPESWVSGPVCGKTRERCSEIITGFMGIVNRIHYRYSRSTLVTIKKT